MMVHEHACLRYKRPEDEAAAVAAFLRAGLGDGDRALGIVPGGERADLIPVAVEGPAEVSSADGTMKPQPEKRVTLWIAYMRYTTISPLKPAAERMLRIADRAGSHGRVHATDAVASFNRAR
jgi:hypothetical protein